MPLYTTKLQGSLIPETLKWPGGVIVYQIDAVLSIFCLICCTTLLNFDNEIMHVWIFTTADEEKAVFQAAVDGFANKTCIKFKKRTCQKDYVSVQKLGGYINYY